MSFDFLSVRPFFSWLFSLEPTEKFETDPLKKLINSSRTTARCRFNASTRLKRLSSYSFFTTTFLSLGLIFIPLVQNSDVQLHFMPKVLNMMQIFLAVAVIVYSVVNGTARYDIRSIQLNECGDKLKDLIRTLREEEKKNNSSANQNLKEYHEKYNDILSESENHTRLDFLMTSLEMVNDYKITGLFKIFYHVKVFFWYAIPFILPSIMMFSEILFILDMLAITNVTPCYLGGDPNPKPNLVCTLCTQ